MWTWKCCFETSYFGRFHPDYEGCTARGRKSFKTENQAKIAGENHLENAHAQNQYNPRYAFRIDTINLHPRDGLAKKMCFTSKACRLAYLARQKKNKKTVVRKRK